MARRVCRTVDEWLSQHVFPHQQPLHAERPDLNLGAERGDVTIREVNGAVGTETPRVTGFDEVLLATSVVVGGNTKMTFFDGSTMTLVGVSDPTKISFLIGERSDVAPITRSGRKHGAMK